MRPSGLPAVPSVWPYHDLLEIMDSGRWVEAAKAWTRADVSAASEAMRWA
jgi:hypothetical protein